MGLIFTGCLLCIRQLGPCSKLCRDAFREHYMNLKDPMLTLGTQNHLHKRLVISRLNDHAIILWKVKII